MLRYAHLRFLLLIAIALLFSSCGIYHSSFDCSPGKGTPCCSVSEIEGMIIETKRGPDIFLPDLTDESGDLGLLGLMGGRGVCTRSPRRVWIAPIRTTDGHIIHGHYVEEEWPCSRY